MDSVATRCTRTRRLLSDFGAVGDCELIEYSAAQKEDQNLNLSGHSSSSLVPIHIYGAHNIITRVTGTFLDLCSCYKGIPPISGIKPGPTWQDEGTYAVLG